MFFKTNAPEAVQAITDFFAKKSALHAAADAFAAEFDAKAVVTMDINRVSYVGFIFNNPDQVNTGVWTKPSPSNHRISRLRAKPLFKEFYNLGIAHAQTPEHLVLDAPARVGGGVFRKGVSMLTVVAAAQRLYDYSSKEQPRPIISAADMLRVATGELVLVPTNPTPKMIDATWDHDEEIQSMSHNTRNEFIYKKMTEASEQRHD